MQQITINYFPLTMLQNAGNYSFHLTVYLRLKHPLCSSLPPIPALWQPFCENNYFGIHLCVTPHRADFSANNISISVMSSTSIHDKTIPPFVYAQHFLQHFSFNRHFGRKIKLDLSDTFQKRQCICCTVCFSV